MSSLLKLRPGHVAPINGQQDHSRTRHVTNRSNPIVRGKFPSLKNGQMVHYEGLLERDAFLWLEASPDIESYREQPNQIYFPDGGRMRRYTPDIEAVLCSGETVIIEVKPLHKTREVEIKHKLERVKAYFDARSQPYVVLTDKFIRQTPHLQNWNWLIRRIPFQQASYQAVQFALRTLSPHLPCSIQHAEQVLSEHRINACHLMLYGYLRAVSQHELLTQETVIEFGTSAAQQQLAGLANCTDFLWTQSKEVGHA